jgi:S-formylglutathione hydrolase FrmB
MTSSRRVLGRPAGAALTVVAALGLGWLPAVRAHAADPPPVSSELPRPNAYGLTLTGAQPVDPTAGADQPKMIDYTMSTDEIFQPRGPDGHNLNVPVVVRVWLPPDYRPDRRRPYPVLFLLHGGGGGHFQWTSPQYPPNIDGKAVLDHAIDPDPTDAVPGTPFPGIVVMPDAGWVGWYTDWTGATQGGFAPNWETFHIRQLVPWIDANFNTSGRRSGRAVAGVSMGGVGSLMYGTRFPHLFSAVGSFSGGPDLTESYLHQTVSSNLAGFPGAGASTGFVGLENEDLWVTSPPPEDVEGRFQVVFGPPGPGARWLERNPLPRAFTYHAYDGRFAVYSGQTTLTFDGEGEGDIGRTNQRFHHALDSVRVRHRYCSGPGTHTSTYFQNDLADFLNYVYAKPWTTCTTNPGWARNWEPTP